MLESQEIHCIAAPPAPVKMVDFLKNRRKMLWLLLAALPAAATVAFVPFSSSGLPNPAAANREELLRWVVTRDLAAESPETRLALAQRLEQEFRAGVDWHDLEGETTEAQRQRLWDNIPMLFEPWFREKAAIYTELPNAQRSKFMDGVIAAISAWRGVDRLRPRPADSIAPGQSRGLLLVFLDQVEECKRKAEPQERERLSQFLAALQMRFLGL